MGRRSTSRNAPCPCGSGAKYKRCCLADEEQALREALRDDAVSRRIENWSSQAFDGEIGIALAEFLGAERVLDDDAIQIFATWFHQDRELMSGGTPVECYSARADLPAAERAVASRIASARLGLYRVLRVAPGRSLELEELVGGSRIEVRSPHVSREVVRWDILLTRVMDGEPATLWGATRFFEPCEEPELRAELARLAGSPAGELDDAALAATFRRHSLELMRWLPPSRSAEPTFFTLEGDPVVCATAVWTVRDPAAAAARFRELGGLLPHDSLEVDITAPRASLVEQRPLLPPGALVIEASPLGAMDTIPIATLRLDRDELRAEAMSEQRLEQTLEHVAADLGGLVELRSTEVQPIDEAQPSDEALGERRRRSPRPLHSDPLERQALAEHATERMRRWLDEPHQLLEGRTPRAAAAGAGRPEVVRLLHQIENSAERARRRGEHAVDVAPLRAELGLADELAA